MRIVGLMFALALALALALPAQAGLYAPAEDVLLSREASFTEEPLDVDAGCASGLSVGTGVRDIVPGDQLPDGSWSLWQETFEDTNGNGVYDAYDPTTAADGEVGTDEPFTDENGNGKYDAPFMAGYGHEKDGNEYYVAEAVHDLVYARAVAITCGDTTVGLVSVDTVGLFRGFVLDVRAAASSEFDHIVIASTHTHDSFDTMGLWGPTTFIDGKSPRAMAHIHDRILEALGDALATRQPVATVKAASGHTGDLISITGAVQTDIRDPFVLDDKVVAAQFLDASGAAIATLVNWAPHPETMAGTKSELSSDYVDKLRRSIETEGATVGGVHLAPAGGTAVFFSGAVGGMMTTLGAKPRDESGALLPDYSYAKADRIGEVAAYVALDALDAAAAESVSGLRVQTRLFNVPADNAFLLAINAIGVLDHETALGTVLLPAVGEPGIVVPVPFLKAEVNVLTLETADGDLLQLLTIPGELLPEVALGNPLRDDADPSASDCFAFNPDKLLWDGDRNGKLNPATGTKQAGFERKVASKPAYPKEPAILSYATGREVMMLGLANDELGYIVPANDFEPATYFPDVYSDAVDRCGDDDHYEETNSASSVMAPAVANNLVQMLDPTFVPAPLPKEMAGLLPDGLGLWVDTSGSGSYDRNEDVRIEGGVPTSASGCMGWLNGHNEDIGQEPSEDVRGFWVDLDGDCAPSKGDGAFFADAWAISEGQPHWRP